MNTHRTRWVVAAVFASAFFLGVASVALAAYAYSPERTFFGPAAITIEHPTIPRSPFPQERERAELPRRTGDCVAATRGVVPCARLAARRLGAVVNQGELLSADVGAAHVDGSYNNTASEDVGSAWYCNGVCPSGSYYATAEGRIWNSNTGQYVTSSFLSYSPDLNF